MIPLVLLACSPPTLRRCMPRDQWPRGAPASVFQLPEAWLVWQLSLDELTVFEDFVTDGVIRVPLAERHAWVDQTMSSLAD